MHIYIIILQKEIGKRNKGVSFEKYIMVEGL